MRKGVKLDTMVTIMDDKTRRTTYGLDPTPVSYLEWCRLEAARANAKKPGSVYVYEGGLQCCVAKVTP